MANSMIKNSNLTTGIPSGNSQENIISKLINFSNEIKVSGKDPKALLDEAMKSGKYTEEQIKNATKKAEQFSSLLRFIK